MQHVYRTITLGTLLLACAAGPAAAVLVEKSIYELQQDQFTLNDSCLVDSVVVIGVDTRPSTFGVYIQEPAGGAYSGILAYMGGTFPAYNNSPDAVQEGDLINVRGTFTDFNGLAELSNPSLNKLGTVTPLAPITLPIDSLKTSNPNSEQWEGVLVKLDSLVCTSIDPVFTRTWRAHHFGGPASGKVDSISIYEKMISGQVTPLVGDQLLSVVGVHDLVSGARFIAPRGDEDLVFLSPAPPPVPTVAYSTTSTNIKIRFNVQLNSADAVMTSHYSLSTFQTVAAATYDNPSKTVTLTIGTPLVPSTTPHVVSMDGIRNLQNVIMTGTESISLIGGISTIPFVQTPVSMANDTSQVVNQQVTIRGVVTERTGVDFPSAIGGFYLQERGAVEYGGVFVFGAPITPSRGDSVLVTGFVTEFGVGPETEITSVDEAVVLATGRPPIQPVVVTLADLTGPNNDPVAEKYEAMLVKVNGVTSLTQDGPGDPFDVAIGLAGPDTVRVDDLAIEESAYTPWRGDVVDVIGIVRYSGSTPFRRLQPRDWNEPPAGDIHVVSKAQVSDAPPGAYRSYLVQNEPNPFNPTTRIAYTIGQAGRASLRVYDLQGRFVATLLDREVGVGTGAVVWNGRDFNGRAVASGVYVVRLLAADSEESRKMILLK